MKKYLLFFLFVGIAFRCFSNNISVSNVTITGQNTTSDFSLVQFDISWDNSWRTSTLESNWDAAWVFVKWRLNTSLVWNHATLNTSGHTAPTGSTVTASSDGKGIFIYKDADAIGTNTWTDAELRWNYGVDGLADDAAVEVCVFAIEMVYVPQGSFYVGDGSTNLQGHFEAGVGGVPFLVQSENSLTLGGGGSGSLGNNNTTGMGTADDFNDATSRTLPANFPKGYNAYYIMKYEITQEEYTMFLNKLTYTQQVTRTSNAPSSAAGTAAFDNSYRNGIDIKTPGTSTTIPAVYACNFDGDATYAETVDGQNIPCNFLTWADLAAYLDWSGFRPFTELEFEKACRGVNISAVADEYAWGNTTITATTAISNSGNINEISSTSGANCVYNTAYSGPVRAGNYARSATTRETSGGSYYGVMELSGNLPERIVTVGNTTGRAFIGLHGDGSLDATGNANVTNWPGTAATGSGFKGGYWDSGTASLRVSDRVWANTIDLGRWGSFGGRGARTAP